MNQHVLSIHDSLADALRDVIALAGGVKKVGAEMRPELPVDQAAAWVRDCLNTERREKFSPDQVLFLLKLGRRINCHAAMNYLALEAGYQALPIEPEDERAQLQRDFIDSVKRQERLADRMERLGMLKAVA